MTIVNILKNSSVGPQLCKSLGDTREAPVRQELAGAPLQSDSALGASSIGAHRQKIRRVRGMAQAKGLIAALGPKPLVAQAA